MRAQPRAAGVCIAPLPVKLPEGVSQHARVSGRLPLPTHGRSAAGHRPACRWHPPRLQVSDVAGRDRVGQDRDHGLAGRAGAAAHAGAGPNKTLAAQLYAEFKEFFPHNAVEYFVSYYDYYQPEAYIARSDTYIEKDSTL